MIDDYLAGFPARTEREWVRCLLGAYREAVLAEAVIAELKRYIKELKGRPDLRS